MALLSKSAGAAEEDATSSFSKLADLNLSEPQVCINGPFPSLMRSAEVGELVQVQIIYPICPPFPTAARIVLTGKHWSSVGVYSTQGKIVAWSHCLPQPPLGVGYLSALLKAVKEGEEQFTVEVRLEDNSIKKVPFAFMIEPAKAK